MSNSEPPPQPKLVSDVLAGSLEIVLCKVAAAVNKLSEEIPEAPGGIKINHHHLLRFLTIAGPVSQQEISEGANVDRSTMTDWIDELEGKGLVERRKNPNDRRAYEIHITDKGIEALEESTEAVEQFRQKAFGALNARDRKTLLELLLRLANSGDLPRACG